MTDSRDETDSGGKRQKRSIVLGPSPYDVFTVLVITVIGAAGVVAIVLRWVRGL